MTPETSAAIDFFEKIRKVVAADSISREPSKDKHLTTQELEVYARRLENNDFENDIDLRRLYGKAFIWFIGCSSIVVYALIVAIGFGWLVFETIVILELIPLVFLNLVAVILIIVRYLFRRNGHPDHHRKP